MYHMTTSMGVSETLKNKILCVFSELKVSDEMLNLMALRYGASSGHMTLESFISLILRLDCMLSECSPQPGPIKGPLSLDEGSV